MRDSTGVPKGTMTFGPMPFGAGGFIIQLDGTGLACSGDEGGAYYRSSLTSKWAQICNSTVLPSSDYGLSLTNYAPAYNDGSQGFNGGAPGVFAIGVAPSSTTTVYHTWNSCIYKNTTGFTSQSTKLGGPFPMHTNLGGERYWGTRLVVDPQNPNVFMCGTSGATNSFTASFSGTAMTVPSPPALPTACPIEIGMTLTPTGGSTCTVTTGSGTSWTVSVSQGTLTNVAVTGSIGRVIYSTDGSTLNQIKFPAGALFSGNPSNSLVACDPSSSVVGGIKQKWAYSIYGTGIKESTTGPGGTFSLLASTPTNVVDVIYDGVGNLWAVDAAGVLYKKTPAGTFTSITMPASYTAQGVAVDSTGNNVVVTSNKGDSNYIYSMTSGASWVGSGVFQPGFPSPNGTTFYSTAIAWMGKTRGPGSNPYPGVVRFVGTKCYLSTGFGVIYTTPPSTYTEWPWFDDSLGIENTVPQNVVWPPNRWPVVALGDWGIVPVLDQKRYTNPHHEPGKTPANGYSLLDCSAWSVDYAPSNPDFLVSSCCFAAQGIHHGYSTDCGKHWTAFTGNHPSGSITPGGMMIAQSTTNLIWKPSQNFRMCESTDGGATWSYNATFPLTGGVSGFGNSQWNRDKGLCCDKTNGDAYIYNDGSGDATLKGIWKKPLGGSWSHVFTGNPGGQAGGTWLVSLKCAPGQQGHLFWKTDNISPLYHSTNGGVSWSNFNTNLTVCYAYGFGAAAPGYTYPAVYMWGVVSGVRGLYVSYDSGATIQLISTNPNGFIDDFADIEGDTVNFGTVLLLTANWGGMIGTYNYSMTLS